jgi:membrane-associated protein
MEMLGDFIQILLHLDQHLAWFVQQYGAWVYALLFLIIFCETGLVVTPFLPGDSLLFVAGTLAAVGGMDPVLLTGVLTVAAILGDTVNYWIGHLLGDRVFAAERPRLIKREYLERTQRFYARHGGKTIILARFVPIVRTFAPFVAGVGSMAYGRFLAYNVVGGILWVVSLVLAGYFFGNLSVVKNNLTLVILGIVFVSVLPVLFEYLRHARATADSRARP